MSTEVIPTLHRVLDLAVRLDEMLEGHADVVIIPHDTPETFSIRVSTPISVTLPRDIYTYSKTYHCADLEELSFPGDFFEEEANSIFNDITKAVKVTPA